MNQEPISRRLTILTSSCEKKKMCGKLSLSQKQSGKERILGVWVQMLPTGWPF